MRAYSQSQGKFIEMPDTVSGGIGSEQPAGMVTETGGTPTESKYSKLKPLLLQAALSDPKHYSTYGGLLGMIEQLEPPKEPTSIQKRKMILNQVTPVINTVEEEAMSAETGLGAMLKARLGGIPGVESKAEMLDRDTKAYARLIASAFASEVGVATDRDVERWLGLMPRVSDSIAERTDRLNRLKKQISTEATVYGVKMNFASTPTIPKSWKPGG